MRKYEKLPEKYQSYHIIIFDGDCGLCETSVRFIIKHDRKSYFHFVSQSSSLGKYLLKKYRLDTIDSIVYISDNKAYSYSDGILEIIKHLDVPYRYLDTLRIIPKRLRDGIYKLIAKYRRDFFSKETHCIIVDDKTRARFLNQLQTLQKEKDDSLS